MPTTSASPENVTTTNGESRARSRTSRACDLCRLRKIRCNGKMPCVSCQSHGVECTYHDRRTRRRIDLNYVLELEKTVDELTLKRDDSSTSDGSGHTASTTSSFGTPELQHAATTSTTTPELLETMVQAAGQLQIDELGNCQYLDGFAGLALLNQIQDHCNHLASPLGQPFLPAQYERGWPASQSLLRSELASGLIAEPYYNPMDAALGLLPSKGEAFRLVRVAFESGSPLLHFVHRPTFDARFDEIYQKTPDLTIARDRRFLALVYELLAIGRHLGGKGDNDSVPYAPRDFLQAGQSLIDITDCHDITSLQAVVCIGLYLLSSGSLRACHFYISLAMGTCTRMGLHHPAGSQKLDLIDQEVRKRVFWTVRSLDTYLTVMLGLPQSLNDQHIRQEYPTDTDDKDITVDSMKLPDPQTLTYMSAVNAHTKLIVILAKIKEHIHVGDTSTARDKDNTRLCSVDYSRIVEAEQDLSAWYAQLPKEEEVMGNHLPGFIKIQLHLRLIYAYVQMVLYRPFLHHAVNRAKSPSFSMRGYACASACVNASMQAIWLVRKLGEGGFLAGSPWFTSYVTIFATVVLLLFLLSNESDPASGDALGAAERGLEVLRALGYTSRAWEDLIERLLEQIRSRRFTQAHIPEQEMLPSLQVVFNEYYTMSFGEVQFPGTQVVDPSTLSFQTIT